VKVVDHGPVRNSVRGAVGQLRLAVVPQTLTSSVASLPELIVPMFQRITSFLLLLLRTTAVPLPVEALRMALVVDVHDPPDGGVTPVALQILPVQPFDPPCAVTLLRCSHAWTVIRKTQHSASFGGGTPLPEARVAAIVPPLHETGSMIRSSQGLVDALKTDGTKADHHTAQA